MGAKVQVFTKFFKTLSFKKKITQRLIDWKKYVGWITLTTLRRATAGSVINPEARIVAGDAKSAIFGSNWTSDLASPSRDRKKNR